MNYTFTTKDKFNIIGISTRTTNENNQGMKDIGELWGKFYNEGIQNKISNKAKSEVISLYTDYEKDYMKPYTIVIGSEASNIDNIPDGMVAKTIPASKYAVFHIKGKLPDELIKAWQYIWSSDFERAYTGDFEIYKDQDEVDIYVAIK